MGWAVESDSLGGAIVTSIVPIVQQLVLILSFLLCKFSNLLFRSCFLVAFGLTFNANSAGECTAGCANLATFSGTLDP